VKVEASLGSCVKLHRDRATLVVVDVQEAFRKAVPDFDRVAENAATLVQGASAMGIPVVLTEQYPKGLGETVPEVAERLPAGTERLEKVRFSAAEAEGFDLDGRDQAIVCGIEAHVCVNQTVLDLLKRGLEVHLVTDAVASRTEENRSLGVHRAERAGGVLTSVETALFELLGGSDAAEFKEVQALVK
jgi:nicotinamidase-related amidase